MRDGHWRAWRANGLVVCSSALPCLACWYLGIAIHVRAHATPPCPNAPFPPSSLLWYRTRACPPGPPGAQAGAWLGFPKISRACLLLASSISRASPLLLCPCRAPALLHDTTRQGFNQLQVWKASCLSTTISPPACPFIAPTSSIADGGAHHPTLSAKKHSTRARARIAIPRRLSSKPTTIAAGPTQPS